MKRTSIPVLLVVLTLFCATFLHHGTAMAGDPAGAISRPGSDRHQQDLIVGTDGTSGDDQEGDPDTAGDTLGYRKLTDLLGGTESAEMTEASQWAELMLAVMDCLVILR